MKKKKEKNYFKKITEKFSTNEDAKSRAIQLRENSNIPKVTVKKIGEEYFVNFSIVRSYYEEIMKIGLKL